MITETNSGTVFMVIASSIVLGFLIGARAGYHAGYCNGVQYTQGVSNE